MLKIYEQKKDTLFPLLGMFIIELVLLMTLNLANLNFIFRFFAFAIMLVILPTFFKRYEKKTYLLIALSLAALGLFIVPSIFGGVTGKYMPIVEKLGILLGVIPFFIFGAFLAMQKFSYKKIKQVLLAFYLGLGLLTLISLIFTIYHYGTPWYYLIYSKDKTFTTIIQYASLLVKFGDKTIRIEALANLGLVSLSALTLTLFTKRQDDKIVFWGSLMVGLVGLSTVVLLATPLALYLAVSFGLILIAIKFWHHPKFSKPLFFGVIGGMVFVLILLRIFYQSNIGQFATFLDKTYFLKEMIVPRLALTERWTAIKDSLHNISLLGHPTYAASSLTGVAIFDILNQDGLLAMLGFMGLIALGIYAIGKTLKKKAEVTLLTMALTVSLIMIIYLCNNYLPLTIYETRPAVKAYFYPFSLDLLLSPFLLFIGYMLFHQPQNGEEPTL